MRCFQAGKRTFIKKLHYKLLSFLAQREIDKVGMFVLIQEGKNKKVVRRNYRLTKSKNCEDQGS
jgi:hypothetical protein